MLLGKIAIVIDSMEAATQLALRLRAVANDHLAHYEPLLLVAAPLLALLAARAVHAAAADVADRGLRAVIVIGSGPGAYGLTAIVVGAIGYLYIRWKASKKHLSGRTDRVDCNLDECQEIIEATRKEVTVIHGNLSAFQEEIQSVHLLVRSLETKLGRLEYTQDHTTRGIHELCEFTKRLDRSPKADTRQAASMPPGSEPESPAAQSPREETPKVLRSATTISASGLTLLAETSMPPKRVVINRASSMKDPSSELSNGASSSTLKKPGSSSSRFGVLRGFGS